MGIYVAPGVYVQEKDVSDIIPNLSTTVAALVGYSTKGDVGDEPVLITSGQQFIEEYGEPVLGQYFHYSALAFLQNGNRLYCKRVHNGALYGGCSIAKTGGTNYSFVAGESSPVYAADSNYPNALFYIFGKDPGTWDNDLKVDIVEKSAADYEFTIVVYQKNSDGDYIEVESWDVSRKTKKDGYGNQMYLEDKINGFSKYIVVADNTGEADTVLPVYGTSITFAGGTNGNAVSDSDVNLGWDAFANPDNVDIRILINGGYTSVTVQTKMKTIAEARKDCIAILDIPYAQLSSVADMVTWRSSTQNFNSSYTALYSPWCKVQDDFNDKIVEVPPSGYVASQYAYNDNVGETWLAPAGFNRGLLNVLGFTNVFTSGERETLYEAQINPLQMFRGRGSVIWGQKTQQTKASALDRVNVRRLMIVIEKAAANFLQNFIFEPNSATTRFRVTAGLDEYLNQLAAGGAFQQEGGDRGYLVQCDSSNNTPAVIDRNELHVDLFIKPIRMAEYVQLRAIITSTGASFDELVARGTLF